MKEEKWKWISLSMMFCVFIICGMIVVVNENPFEIRFDASSDDETIELVKAIQNAQCLDDKISFCEKSCHMAYDYYRGNDTFVCSNNWCRHDCFELCYEQEFGKNR